MQRILQLRHLLLNIPISYTEPLMDHPQLQEQVLKTDYFLIALPKET